MNRVRQLVCSVQGPTDGIEQEEQLDAGCDKDQHQQASVRIGCIRDSNGNIRTKHILDECSDIADFINNLRDLIHAAVRFHAVANLMYITSQRIHCPACHGKLQITVVGRKAFQILQGIVNI